MRRKHDMHGTLEHAARFRLSLCSWLLVADRIVLL